MFVASTKDDRVDLLAGVVLKPCGSALDPEQPVLRGTAQNPAVFVHSDYTRAFAERTLRRLAAADAERAGAGEHDGGVASLARSALEGEALRKRLNRMGWIALAGICALVVSGVLLVAFGPCVIGLGGVLLVVCLSALQRQWTDFRQLNAHRRAA